MQPSHGGCDVSRRIWPQSDEEIIAYVHEHDADFPEVEYEHVDEPHGGHPYEASKPEPSPSAQAVTELHIYKDTAPASASWLKLVELAASSAVEPPPMPQPADHEHEWKEMMTGAFRNEYVTYCPGCMLVKGRVIRDS